MAGVVPVREAGMSRESGDTELGWVGPGVAKRGIDREKRSDPLSCRSQRSDLHCKGIFQQHLVAYHMGTPVNSCKRHP